MSEDTEDIPEYVDVSGYKTAAGAAKATQKALQNWAEFYGHDPENITLYNPSETREKRNMHSDTDCWTVSWEGGPSEWAPSLTGGEWIGWSEYGGSSEPEVSGLLDGKEFGVDCYYSFDLQFYNL